MYFIYTISVFTLNLFCQLLSLPSMPSPRHPSPILFLHRIRTATLELPPMPGLGNIIHIFEIHTTHENLLLLFPILIGLKR